MEWDSENSLNDTSKIFNDKDKIITKLIQEIYKTIKRIDIFDSPSTLLTQEPLKIAIDGLNKKIKSRCITKVTKENIAYCRQLISIVDEVHHLDEIKGNFLINETTHASIFIEKKAEKPSTQLIISNFKLFIEQQQSFFDLLWDNSILAYQKIKEIEEGETTAAKEEIISLPTIKTEIVTEQKEIIKRMADFYKTSEEIKFCSQVGSLKLIYSDFFKLHQEILDRYRQGSHKGIRWITSLNKDEDIELIKKYADKGIEIRHVRDLLSTSFALSDKTFLFTIEKIEEGKLGNNILNSNDKLYLEHYGAIFENLWKRGIDINKRIKDIEEGHYIDVEIIPNPKESMKIFGNLFSCSKKEILMILSSANAVERIEKNNDFDKLEKLTYEGIKIKVIIPTNKELQNKINELKVKYSKIDFRSLYASYESFIGITVIDREKVLILEIKDDVKRNYIDSIGLTIFFKGKSTALSYASIFDNLWRQTELNEQLKEAFTRLQIHEKMQKDFINTAAHELRTPIQPILGISNILKNMIKDDKQNELLDVIARNAKRLKKLSEDVLDVSKIESNLLNLNKEHFTIKETIQNTINDYKKELLKKNITIEFKSSGGFFIYADKTRISQVISNLISNSIKFIPDEKGEGNISIIVKKNTIYKNNGDSESNDAVVNSNNQMIVITVKDNGIGIDEENLPRLFTKFTTTSFQGMGLGLYLSKSIVEAHGGRIWAENNKDGEQGATFGFSLPLDDKKIIDNPY